MALNIAMEKILFKLLESHGQKFRNGTWPKEIQSTVNMGHMLHNSVEGNYFEELEGRGDRTISTNIHYMENI